MKIIGRRHNTVVYISAFNTENVMKIKTWEEFFFLKVMFLYEIYMEIISTKTFDLY
jgi:hypothetical protein